MSVEENEFERLLAAKTDRLEELRGKKPGQKHYKRTLRAFLDADAATQKALLARIEAQTRTAKPAEARSSAPAPEAPPHAG